MITLRPATCEDAAFLFRLRNDPASRSASLNTEEVDWGRHVQWLGERLARGAWIRIATLDGADVGMVRAEDGALSWAIAPAHRGGGLGRAMLIEATRSLPGDLTAVIRSSNVASRRMAEHAGFVLRGEADGVCRYLRPALD